MQLAPLSWRHNHSATHPDIKRHVDIVARAVNSVDEKKKQKKIHIIIAVKEALTKKKIISRVT